MTFLNTIATIPTETFSAPLFSFDSLQQNLDILGNLLAIISALFAAMLAVRGAWKKLINPYFSFKKYVTSVYSQEKLTEVSKYYIPTRAQDMDPCEQDEIKENNGKYFSRKLIHFFIAEAFQESSAGKFYLVLADSGMGKTTFLLRFKQAISNCDSFFEELIKITSSFNKVVITCRTQFFPSSKEEPSGTNYIQTGSRYKRTEIVKKYLSPFTDGEVRLYLLKRFGLNLKLQRRAFNIIRKVPNIMARPLILNWINFLCDSDEDYKYSYQIYDTIITKWIEREDLGHSKRRLFELSRAISDYMFKHETITIPAKKVEEIATQKRINLEPIIAKSRSLLNRNGRGEYKFAHRSFLEYFIVFGIFEKMQMPEEMDFLCSLSGAIRFLLEILVSSVEATDSFKLSEIEAELIKYKKTTNIGSIIEFIQNPKIQICHHNSEIGFTIEAWQTYEDTEAYNAADIIKFSELITDWEGSVYRTVPDNRTLRVGLVFSVIAGEMPPHTTLDINIIRENEYCSVYSNYD